MAESKSVFRWTDECKVNIAVLDQQHRELLDIQNKFERALRVGEGNTVTAGILDRLLTYAGSHFDAEESLMERYQFPGLQPIGSNTICFAVV